jgi:hypothetical protein
VTRRLATLVALGIVCVPFTTVVPATTPAHAAASTDLRLVAQSFNVAADGTLTATLGLPATLQGTDVTGLDLVVTTYERVENRESLTPIIGPPLGLPPRDDSVAISPACCATGQAGELSVSVPLEISEVSPDALSVARAGLYPVTFAVRRNGRVVAQVLSFFNRLPAVGETTDSAPMNIALAIDTRSQIHLDSNATIGIDTTAPAEMTALADALDTLTANKLAATVRITPRVLTALQPQSALFNRLIAALQFHRVVAEPQWPLDASAAGAAQQDQLYTAWLRDGRDQLRQLGLGPSVITSSTVLVDDPQHPIGVAGATLQRNLGAELLVMTPKLYDSLDGSIKVFSDNRGELFAADLANGTTISVAVVDHKISQLLANPMATPEQTRIYIVANLLALRQYVLTNGDDPQQRSVVIGMPDLGIPDPSALSSVTELIAQTPGLASATLDDVGFRTDRLVEDGVSGSVSLPSSKGDDLKARIFIQAKLGNDIDAVASMLPAEDARPQQWRDLAAVLPTSALDDTAADGMSTSIESDLASVRNAVQIPAGYTINLSGKRSTVRIRFLNTADVPLKIKVQLSSPPGKLVFQNSDDPVELEPGVPKEVTVGVEARSNGTSGVSLDVSTPNDVPLAPTVALTFRVRALGLGNVLTGIVFVLVLLWWLQHVRSTWRRRRRAVTATLPAS